jgi:hypothetical protein
MTDLSPVDAMTNPRGPMTNPYRALCAELVDLLERSASVFSTYAFDKLASQGAAAAHRARSLLDQQEPEGPSDEEIMELMPQQMRDDLANAARALAGLDRAPAKAAGAMRIILNRHAVDHARAVLAKWGHPTPQPVAVSERLPEPSVKVLAHYFNALGKGRTICAIWVPAKSRSDEGDLDADDFLEYDEESDKYHWPEGWYEAIENWEELGWAKVYEGEIAYWQPLPQWSANALPIPEATND